MLLQSGVFLPENCRWSDITSHKLVEVKGEKDDKIFYVDL